MSDEWVVLREHGAAPSLFSMDGDALALLSLEAELHGQGVEAVFDPCRPGEAASWTHSVSQPLRLLVRAVDLHRAQTIAAALDAEPVADPALDEDFEDFGEPVE